MNEKVLKTLEYYKITDRLKDFAATDMAKQRCQNLQPMTDMEAICEALNLTNDAVSRSFAHSAPSFGGFHDCIPAIKRLEIGSALNVTELLSISALLDAAAKAKSYAALKEDKDSLSVLFENIDALGPLNREIKRCILSEDEISDDASTELKTIRRKIKAAQERIHTELTSMLNNPTIRTYLQDYVITTRNNRYCLPVKAEYKSSVPGMVHDQSATGSSFFIEPMAVVKLNNELKELSLQEQAEIEVILARLSAEAAPYTEQLALNQENLVELDFTFAKAALSRLYKCTCPVMNCENQLSLKQARHPLIDPNAVVPVDIRLGDEFDLLIITGPNTGGKTVSLKTVGLLTLMAQSGLNIPALDHSKLAVFKKVYADIGDEQSIEQSLSTFSSHMTNTVKILRYADANTLILFDEIGAGTDPTEGAALATAILANLHKRGIRTIATTHYSELKLYALSTPGVENASCEFDVESLRPTYRLLIGVPGKSNAFAISSKLGLSDYIIRDAQKRIETQDVQFEDVLSGLEGSRVALEKERNDVKALQEEAARLKTELEKERRNFDEQHDKILNRAREEAAKILSEAKEYADETIRTMNKHGMTIQELEKSRTKIRNKMNDTNSQIGGSGKSVSTTTARKKHKPEEFILGTRVHVISLNLDGTVSTRPDSKGYLFVQMGIIRSKLHIDDLELIEEDAFGNAVRPSGNAQSKKSSGSFRMNKAASISPEINLLGCTVDEAIARLEKYLDDAYLSGIASVRIVHGKGTGALRNGVTAYLKSVSYIKSFRLGEQGEGDAGVTIAQFK